MCYDVAIAWRQVLFNVASVFKLLTLLIYHLGVVDGYLRVYNTKNLRVVDASIIPLQISAHMTSTVYGVAEKAADMILRNYK